jgi:DeoR family suf operon transcriptional repressor
MDTGGVPVSAPQRRVLRAVKRRGEATADELSTELEISASAVRQHLTALRSAGLITARHERGQPGRPADRYRATERAEAVFATGDAVLSIEILDHAEEEDPELVGRIFDRRRRRLVDETEARLAGASDEERVEILADLLDGQGYLADFDRIGEGRYRINLHNCAMWDVACRYRQVCASELDFMRELMPHATVQRVTHKTAGAHTCTYDIRLGT